MKIIRIAPLALGASLAAAGLQAQSPGAFTGTMSGELSGPLAGTALACFSDIAPDMRSTMIELDAGRAGSMTLLIPGTTPRTGTTSVGNTSEGLPFVTFGEPGASGSTGYTGERGTLTITAADRQHVRGTLQVEGKRDRPTTVRTSFTVSFNAERVGMTNDGCRRGAPGGPADPQSAAELIWAESVGAGEFALVVQGSEASLARGEATWCWADKGEMRLFQVSMKIPGSTGSAGVAGMWPQVGRYGVGGEYDNQVHANFSPGEGIFYGREGVVNVTSFDPATARGDFEIVVRSHDEGEGEYTLTGAFHATPGPTCQIRR